jgi:hypothetical protein
VPAGFTITAAAAAITNCRSTEEAPSGWTTTAQLPGARGTASPAPTGTPPAELDGVAEEGDGPDPFFAGRELYRALRGAQGNDPLTDELLWDGDFMASQREFMQKKQEEALLERLERRMGACAEGPLVCRGVSTWGPASSTSSTSNCVAALLDGWCDARADAATHAADCDPAAVQATSGLLPPTAAASQMRRHPCHPSAVRAVPAAPHSRPTRHWPRRPALAPS